MEEQLDRDEYQQLSRLRDDPQPLLKALEHYPFTLLHGDYRAENLAHLAPDQSVAIDWQMATRSLVTVDLAWFTGQWSHILEAIGKTKLQSYYRGRLEAYLDRRWSISAFWLMLCVPPGFQLFWHKHTEDPKERVYNEQGVKERHQQVRDATLVIGLKGKNYEVWN